MPVGAKKALPFVISVAVLVMSALCCVLLYHVDNKYTHPGPQARQGVLLLSEPRDGPESLSFLVEGWAYYHGRLLAPSEFLETPPQPDEYLFIGQYGGLDRGDFSASPHGSATYRMHILLPEESRQYALELPEIFSAYRLYIGGREIASMGVPERENYRPATGNRLVVFEAGGIVEILVAVSDYSHFYSGMVYPPAFGSPTAVSRLIAARQLFRSLLCAGAGIIGVLALLTGALARKLPLLWYGLLCLFLLAMRDTHYGAASPTHMGHYMLWKTSPSSWCS